MMKRLGYFIVDVSFGLGQARLFIKIRSWNHATNSIDALVERIQLGSSRPQLRGRSNIIF